MKLETKKRIEAYQKALPHMKERVMAVALLFAMSITMVISTSFAWITLSRAPEVNGLSTTISTNGNLEIALSNPEGTEPDETKIGDGSGNITESNLTWGNLINLADDAYGLSKITLRPAELNYNSLGTSPMSTAKYDADGRITGYLNDFSYTNYDKDLKDFVVSKKQHDDGTLEKITNYGVRAISTVTYKDLTGDQGRKVLITNLEDKLRQISTEFTSIYDTSQPKGKAYMITVGELVSVHTNWTLEPGMTHVCTYEQIKSLYNLSQEFYALMGDGTNNISDKEGVGIGAAIVDMANLYLYLEDRDKYMSDKYTFEDLIAGELTEKYKERIDCLEYYLVKTTKSDGKTEDKSVWYKTEQACKLIEAKYNELKAREEAGEVNITTPWDANLRKAVNYLCDMDTATLDGSTVGDINGMIAKRDLFGLMDFANKKKPAAVINDGALADASQLLGIPISVESSPDIQINASVVISSLNYTFDISMQPSISTVVRNNRPKIHNSKNNVSQDIMSGESNYKGDEAAADTYAMVMDIWVRTNSLSSLLVLEGEPKYAREKGTDDKGNKVGLLYDWKTKDENDKDVTLGVYEYNGIYYYEGTSEKVDPAPAQNEITALYEAKPYAYEGVNRVWDELDEDGNIYEAQMPEGAISTTQGSGSCYIFYSDSPEDQEQSLKFLSAMKVAFIDSEGTLLAEAKMRPDLAVENAGRVIVPLVLDLNTTPIIDEDGNTISYYITPLTQNEPKRITAIVYLDGRNLTNTEVMSAGSITGQLNIQFGTTDAKLAPIEDEKLMGDYYGFEFNTYDETLGEAEADWNLDLELILTNGSAPRTIKGTFVSIINASQGARQPQFEFVREGDTNKWKANVKFTGPGNYQLKSLQIDGTDYLLDKGKIVKIKIPGTQITSLTWDSAENKKSVLTAEKFYEQTLNLVINSQKSQYEAVKGVFIGENGQNVTVEFSTTDGTNYIGTAKFTTSGTYSLTYLYIGKDRISLIDFDDDDEIVRDISKTITIQLGLTARVNLFRPTIYDGTVDDTVLKDVTGDINKGWSFIYSGGKALKIGLTCQIFDDQGNEIKNLENPKIYYRSGSITNALDADLAWSTDHKKYYAEFTFNSSGNFVFYSVDVVVGGIPSSITVASVSPEITAIPPAPMSYVAQPDYNHVVYDLSGNTVRALEVKLKNADAAKLDGTIKNEKGESVVFANVMRSGDAVDGVSTFRISVPNDGYWEIDTLNASQVFYDDIYYSGGDNVLNLNSLRNDDISATFITEAYLTVNNAPSKTNYSGEFMAITDNVVTGMKISLVDYAGKPLESVLKSVGINDEVVIDMKYNFTLDNSIVSSISGTAPNQNFTVSSRDDNGTVTMEDINFTLPGRFDPEWSVKIGDKYTFSYKTGADNVGKLILNGDSAKRLKDTVVVTWTKPEITFTAVSGSGSNSISADKHSADTYYEKVSSGCLDDYVPATITVYLDKAGNASSAVLTYPLKSNNTAVFNIAGNKKSASSKLGDTGNGSSPNTGTFTCSEIVLVHNGVNYKVKLAYSLSIKLT